MISTDIKMTINSPQRLCDYEGGHFLFKDRLYIKTRPMEKDIRTFEGVYFCVDDEGHVHKDEKNITFAIEMSIGMGYKETTIDSDLKRDSLITPVGIIWR